MKENKILTKLLICLVLSIWSAFVYCTSYTDASFADYTDEQAHQEAEEIMQQQQQEEVESENKSRDCFLDSLEVEGYELTPEFDKQTIDYVIKGKKPKGEIEIKATPSNSNAKVEGAGKVKLQDGQDTYKIDVTAESGTVRTYFIHLDEESKDEAIEAAEKVEEESDQTIQHLEDNEEKKDNSLRNKLIIGGVIILLVIVAVIIIIKKK